MSNITTAIQSMDLLKKRYLQLEYLGKMDKITFSGCFDSIKNIDELVKRLEEDIEYVEGYIPKAVLEFLDSGDYDVYTRDNYGRKFWNEIELSDKAQKYFDVFQKLMDCEETAAKKYELQFYDLYPNSLYFETIEELEKIIEAEDFAPFTVFENDGGISRELYSA